MDERIPAQGERARAAELAYRALGQRDRTTAEMRAYLERKRVGPMAIEQTIVHLHRAGQLDDAGYARRLAEDKRALERWGAERIARDLRRRGVAPELVESALAGRERANERAHGRGASGHRHAA